MASYANPQSLNRFAYVLNNPLRYTDPTGHKETACASQNDPACSAVNGGPTGNTSTNTKHDNHKDKKDLSNQNSNDNPLENGGLDYWEQAIKLWPSIYQEQLDKYTNLYYHTSEKEKPYLYEFYATEVIFWRSRIEDDGTINSFPAMNAAKSHLQQAMYRARLNGELPGGSIWDPWDQYDSSGDYPGAPK